MKTKLNLAFSILFVMVFALTACAKTAAQPEKVKVVASTTMVGDVVRQVGGDFIELTVLFPVGTDPHTFEPRPQDAAAIADAQIVFLNGLELEHALEPVVESNATGQVVEVSEGIEALQFSSELHQEDEGEEVHHEEEGEEHHHDHSGADPHTWMDPNLVIIWVTNISDALSNLDPQHAASYQANAEAYTEQLTDLDAWIREEVAKIPPEDRKLVTDHENMGYFIQRYGFTLSGLIVDSLSTNASPSAKELAALTDNIKSQNVKAIFVGSAVNPSIAEQIANDTGVKLITVKTESLGEEGSETATYILYMKTLVNAIVNGLQ